MEQRHFDLIGLALIAVAVFFSLVFYLSWDGGRMGDALALALRYLLGYVAYLAPIAFFAAGALLILRSFIPSLTPFKVGAACLLSALTLGLSAQTFGIGPAEPSREGVLYAPYLTEHGGLVGELLYASTSALFHHVGAVLISVFLALAGALLLTRATVAGVIRTSKAFLSDAARKATMNTQEFVARLEARIKRGDTAETSEYQKGDMDPQFGAVSVELEGDEIVPQEELGQSEALDQKGVQAGTPNAVLRQGSDGAEAGQAAHHAGMGDIELTPQGNRRSDVTESERRDYKLPNSSFLKRSAVNNAPDTSNRSEVAEKLIKVLSSFNVEAKLIGTVSGPHITRYELQLEPGTKVAKVSQLKDDIAYALASTEIRILAPIPGKRAVGVEVPNQSRRIVHLGDILNTSKKGGRSNGLPKSASHISVWLGKDISGKAIWTDIARMPHLLVAGTTGSGKSGCINTMLSSILLRSTPDQVRMVLIDTKLVELNYYESIPHLLAPLVTSPRLAANVLGNLVKEMEARYELMSEDRCRNIAEFNSLRKKEGEPSLPHILCVVDELADLMMVASADVEDAIIRLSQKSRAVGIHLVLATQRPSTDIITGTIKVNVPARISFSVSSQVDSRVILDQGGAESLLGQGDMLFRPAGSSKLQRIQGAYVTEGEIDELTAFWCEQGEPKMQEEIFKAAPESDEEGGDLSPDQDELLEKAITLVVQTQTASVSMLQRRLRVGYTRAGRLIDMLERRGFISGYEGSKPRQVLIQESELARVLDREKVADAGEEDSQYKNSGGILCQ